MAEGKPKNSRQFYRIAIGIAAFIVLAGGIYYFINKNKSSADVAATSTKTLQVNDVGISNYTTNCKSEFLKLSSGYRCNKIKVTIENAPANLTATNFFSDLALKKKVGDAIIQNGLGGFTNFSATDFCTMVKKNISPNVPDATQIGTLIEKAIIYDGGIKKGCDTVDNAGTNNVSSPYQVSIPDVTIKLATPAVTTSTTATAQTTSSASGTLKVNATVKDTADKIAQSAKVNLRQASATSDTQGLGDCTTSADGTCSISIPNTSDIKNILSIVATSSDFKQTGSTTLQQQDGVNEYSVTVKFGTSGEAVAPSSSDTKCLKSHDKYLIFNKKISGQDIYWESTEEALLDSAVQKLTKDGNEDATKQKCTVADATTKVTFRVITNTIKDGKGQPVNTAKIQAQNAQKGIAVCTTGKDGACSLTKTDLRKIIEQFKTAKDTNNEYQKSVEVLAYKSFKEVQSKSLATPLSLDKTDYEFKLALDEAQAGESINYTAQGIPGIDSGLPTLGNNALTFSAKRESNKDLVRIGGVSFELTGRVSSAKAADSNAIQRTDTTNSGASAAKGADSTNPDKAQISPGEPGAAASISRYLTGGNLRTIKGVIPDDGRDSRVTIPNLPDGIYRLVLRKNLFDSVTVSNITLEGGTVQDYDTSTTVSADGKTILLKPKTNAEPPALPSGYTANKIPLSKDYLVATKGQYAANSSDNLYYSFIEPTPGWTNNIFVERQIDPNDPRDQKRLEKVVNDCISKQGGMNTSINANVSSNTLKNLGYFNAAYQLFLNPDKGSNQDALMQAISGIGLTQILARNGSGSYNVNIDLFNKCGISPSIIRNPAYDYNYGQANTSSGLNIGSLLGLFLGGQNASNNGTYYGDKLTLDYCRMISSTMNANIVENPQTTQEKLICEQRYGIQMLTSQIYGNNSSYNPYSTGSNNSNSALNQYVANEFNKLKSCAGTKLFLSDSPVVYDQNIAQEIVLRMKDEYERCSSDRANYRPNGEWRDFNFLTRFGFIDSSPIKRNKVLSNTFNAFRSCASNKISISKAPAPYDAQIAQEIFGKMIDEYDRCSEDKAGYVPGGEWSDINFLSRMGFLSN